MATATQVTASIGSISSGTLLSSDLIDAFSYELQRLDVDGTYATLIEQGDEFQRSDGKDEELGSDLVNELQDALSEFAPPFTYFGAIEGDGADFGFWFDSDALAEAQRCGLKLDSGDAWATSDGYIIDVSDHGNVEVYAMERGESVMSVV